MSSTASVPPAAVRQTAFRQEGEASIAHPNNDTDGVAVRDATDTTEPDLRMLQRRTMSSAAKSGKTVSSRRNTFDESRSSQNDFRGRGISWAIICPALCTVVGLTFAYYYTGNYVFALSSATILRAIGLCAVMVPALFSKEGFRLERRRTFALLCLMSLISVIIAWVLWHKHVPKWPQVLITVSDVFSAVAGAQLAISSAHELTPIHQDEIEMDERWAGLEAQHTHMPIQASASRL